ncbi:MAG: SAF domain-containing protein [Actinomycetes bacterium]
MVDIKNVILGSPRTRLAAVLIALSLLAAIAISSAANRATWVWSAARDLSAGHTIAATDLKAVKVNLYDSGGKYLSSGSPVLGWHLTRSIQMGELIPGVALSRQGATVTTQSLPLRVSRPDMPIDLAPGQRVDLYALSPTTAQATFDPLLAFANATIESVDQKSKDLGGDIGIVVAIPKSAMLQVVGAIASARVLVVRNAF